MEEARIPENEQQRLAHLQNLHVLDTPVEERFERITRVLRRVLDVPIAAVSLIDDRRQWFKSIQGLESAETPRNISFCSHAILNDKTLVIPDTKLDPRFSNNPLVTGEPNVRFYAGHPLKIADNIRVGTLCVFGTKPRNLQPEDLQFLQDLALTTSNELKTSMLKTLFTQRG